MLVQACPAFQVLPKPTQDDIVQARMLCGSDGRTVEAPSAPESPPDLCVLVAAFCVGVGGRELMCMQAMCAHCAMSYTEHACCVQGLIVHHEKTYLHSSLLHLHTVVTQVAFTPSQAQ